VYLWLSSRFEEGVRFERGCTVSILHREPIFDFGREFIPQMGQDPRLPQT
jgi:hypothetical protein